MTMLFKSPLVTSRWRELKNGDRMTREEFHAIYERSPEGFKAELIGGIVHVASPLGLPHGRAHLTLGTLFGTYAMHTPGVECADNTTVFLGRISEPQPDLILRILPENGGQSSTTADDYVSGAPELIAEVSDTTAALDLTAKRKDYKKYGVLEYLVLDVNQKALHWFDLPGGKELSPDSSGICRIRTFPGLWIHVAALLERNSSRLTGTLKKGIASSEHREFVKKLAARARETKL
jgi:Uma2 family endonuclease